MVGGSPLVQGEDKGLIITKVKVMLMELLPISELSGDPGKYLPRF